MKICPQCKTKYDDDTLNFCLEDGSVLSQAPLESAPPPTVMVPSPRESIKHHPPAPTRVQDEVQTAPRHQIPRQKSSKRWLWVLGILLGVGVLCSGGFIGLVALVPVDDEPGDDPVITTDRGDKRDSNGDPDRRLAKEDDLADWDVNENDYISSEVRDGALVLTSVDDYYYIILSKGFETYDRSTLLTVRNITGEEASSGYGLVLHSYPTEVLEQDYALLIRSDTGTYRIVQHRNKKERVLVKWKNSKAIRRGKLSNDLEARAYGGNIEFFINGEFVEKIRDYRNYKDGVAGIYTSDDIPIAFSRLELRK